MTKKIFHFIYLPLTLILTWLSVPNIAFAAAGCVPGNKIGGIDAACPPTNNYRCNYVTQSGDSYSYCCTNSTTCVAQKQDLALDASQNAGNTPAKRDIFYPTGSCGDGAIDTALGCLPYTADGFTPALLGFLAGVVGAISLVVMLIATVQIMAGGGNPEAVKKGKELFTGAVTGLLFIIFSVTLLKIIAGDVIQLPGF